MGEAEREVPELVESLTDMETPNERVSIHTGVFYLQDDKQEIGLEGRVFYSWFPHINVLFEGKCPENSNYLFQSVFSKSHFDFIIDHPLHGVVTCGKSKLYKANSEGDVSGVLIGSFILGDKNIAVDHVHFEVPNLKDFLGDAVRYKNKTCANRLR